MGAVKGCEGLLYDRLCIWVEIAFGHYVFAWYFYHIQISYIQMSPCRNIPIAPNVRVFQFRPSWLQLAFSTCKPIVKRYHRNMPGSAIHKRTPAAKLSRPYDGYLAMSRWRHDMAMLSESLVLFRGGTLSKNDWQRIMCFLFECETQICNILCYLFTFCGCYLYHSGWYQWNIPRWIFPITKRRFVDLWSDLITYTYMEMRSVILTFLLHILQLAVPINIALGTPWGDRVGYQYLILLTFMMSIMTNAPVYAPCSQIDRAKQASYDLRSLMSVQHW